MRRHLMLLAVPAVLVGCLWLGACNGPAGGLGAAAAGPAAAVSPEVQRMLERQQADDRQAAAMLARLNKPIPEIAFDKVQLGYAVQTLSELGQVDIQFIWGAMEALGITKNTEISLRLRDVPVRVALDETLRTAAGRPEVLGWMIDGSAVRISTREDLWTIKTIRIYNVRDLLEADRAYVLHLCDLLRGVRPRVIVVDEKGERSDWTERTLPSWSYSEAEMRLLEILRVNVLPDSWAPAGDASVLEHEGLLIVKQTWPGHAELSHLLAGMRQALAAARPAPPAYPPPVLTPFEEALRPLADGMLSQSVQEKLRRPMESVSLEGARFEDALNLWAEKAGVNLVVNWGAIEQVGIKQTTRVTLSRRPAPADEVLRAILVTAVGQENVFDFVARDGVVRVSTREDLSMLREVRFYDIRDLMASNLAWHQRRLWAFYEGQMPREVVYQPARADEEEGLHLGDHDEETDFHLWSPANCVNRLREVLRTAVMSDSWAPTGSASVIEHDGILVINQTLRGHREVEMFLAQLRAALAAAE